MYLPVLKHRHTFKSRCVPPFDRVSTSQAMYWYLEPSACFGLGLQVLSIYILVKPPHKDAPTNWYVRNEDIQYSISQG